MLTLAIDTATITASCAISENGKILSELNMQYGMTHSKKIVPMIKSMLKMIDKSFSDIDLYAASIGPGSFTGLRIGIVTIKGIAYAHKKPVCAVPTLDALAFSMPEFNGVISPMIDARNSQVYTALYRNNNGYLDKILPERGIHIDKWIDCLKDYSDDVLILGDAASLHSNKMKASLEERIIYSKPDIFYPRAASTALLAEQKYYNKQFVSPFDLTPMYLRKSQAERLKELKEKS